MWCSKPKPKVGPRPKPILGHQRRRELVSNDCEEQIVKQHDPHRERRNYGMKHTDITRIFLVEDRTCHVPPDQPYGLRKTDITRYLERVVPSHAFQPSTTNGQSQATPRNNSNCKKEVGDIRGSFHPARPPSRWETRESRSNREACRENIRPDTAPSGEMKKLSATNVSTVSLCSKPASVVSRRATASSPLKPAESVPMLPPPLRHGSRPGSTQASECGGESQGTEGGAKDSKVWSASGSPLMTAASGGRLQPVPE